MIKGNIGITLRRALDQLFANNSAVILIAESKELGVMHYGEKYNFTDSHSWDKKYMIVLFTIYLKSKEILLLIKNSTDCTTHPML